MNYLTDKEVQDITRRKQRAAQKRVLNAMGIDCRARGDGSWLVLWHDVIGDSHNNSNKNNFVELNLGAISGT